MAYVVVDPQTLHDTANQITQYVNTQKNGMQQIDNVVSGLRTNEIGAEFDLLQQKWEQAKGTNSTSMKMLTMLEGYASYLKSCAQNYEIAQSNARIYSSRI